MEKFKAIISPVELAKLVKGGVSAYDTLKNAHGEPVSRKAHIVEILKLLKAALKKGLTRATEEQIVDMAVTISEAITGAFDEDLTDADKQQMIAGLKKK